jgi:hypothetical protein
MHPNIVTKCLNSECTSVSTEGDKLHENQCKSR